MMQEVIRCVVCNAEFPTQELLDAHACPERGSRYYAALGGVDGAAIDAIGDQKRPVGANARQVGGDHYAKPIQHWDYVVAQGLGYFEGQITKYVSRWRAKNGLEDLKKARHFLDKLIEEVEAGRISQN